ncbi:hypothetical protein TNCV_3758651 [Trichonephila clavipes]|nr:hypothetical protein TNCV_3758651 [Trichonephila clavipes]
MSESYIYVGLKSNARAIDYGLRNFEPRSSDESTLPFPQLSLHTNGRTLSLDRLYVDRPPLLGGSSVAPGLEPATLRPRVRDHNHEASIFKIYKAILTLASKLYDFPAQRHT